MLTICDSRCIRYANLLSSFKVGESVTWLTTQLANNSRVAPTVCSGTCWCVKFAKRVFVTRSFTSVCWNRKDYLLGECFVSGNSLVTVLHNPPCNSFPIQKLWRLLFSAKGSGRKSKTLNRNLPDWILLDPSDEETLQLFSSTECRVVSRILVSKAMAFFFPF